LGWYPQQWQPSRLKYTIHEFISLLPIPSPVASPHFSPHRGFAAANDGTGG
jgi:hypothetical protein